MFATKKEHKELLNRLIEEKFMITYFNLSEHRWKIKHQNHIKPEDIYYVKYDHTEYEKRFLMKDKEVHYFKAFSNGVTLKIKDQTHAIEFFFILEQEFCAKNEVEFYL